VRALRQRVPEKPVSVNELARLAGSAGPGGDGRARSPAADQVFSGGRDRAETEHPSTSSVFDSHVLDEYEETDNWFSRLRSLWVPAAILAVVAGVILYFLHDTAGVRREAPDLPTLVATLPPPPPPPPPPKEPEVEKRVEIQQKTVETPKADAPRPITINGPAQAGSDAFNVGAGSGGGEVGSGNGLGDASYTGYLCSTFQQTIQNDSRFNTLVFSADVAVWVNEGGHVTRVEILRSSGDPKTDQNLVAAIEATPALDELPPSTFEFPQRITVRGRAA
jgi:periplasmic protein TonB